jgi:glycosyltransferase involved in cell wall biosynthesis
LTSQAKVSVIIPTYNRPRFLSEAVGSVLGQTESSLEIIVADDGSSESCREKIGGLRSLDSRLKVFHLPKNRGPAAARNLGLSQAIADFIMFLDDDDLLLPETLRSNLDCFRRHAEADAVCCRSRLCFSRNLDGEEAMDRARDERTSVRPKIRLVDQLDGRRLEQSPFSELLRFPPPIHSLLFRKRCFDTTLFPEDLHVGEDVTFMLRLARQGLRFKFNPGTEVLVRQHGANFVNRPDHFSRTAVYLSKLQGSGLIEEKQDQWLCQAKLFLALARDGQVRCLRSLLPLFRSPARLARYALGYIGLQLKKDRYLRKTKRPRPAPLEVATIAKPRLLYISPVTPAPSGRGIAMRAHHNLLALAAGHRISLLIIPTGLRSRPPVEEIFSLCESVTHLRLHILKDFPLLLKILSAKIVPSLASRIFKYPTEMASFSTRRAKRAVHALAGAHFPVVHVFRFYHYPYALSLPASRARPILQLDLDEIDSSTRRSLADLFFKTGRRRTARRMLREARKYEAYERRALSFFDRIFLSSALEANRIQQMYGCRNVETLPNVMINSTFRTPRQRSECFVFLMVGVFSYFPNRDGIEFFCSQILPLIRSRTKVEFIFRAVGPGLSRRLVRRLSAIRGVELKGYVPDIRAAYAGADAAVVPIRAGGGTRIKILEAMASGVPVISTSKGAEGLELRPEAEILTADTAYEFAEQCCRLLHDPELRLALADNARQRMTSSFQLDRAKIVHPHQGFLSGPAGA